MKDRYQIVSQESDNQVGVAYIADDTMLKRRVRFHHIEAEGEIKQSDAWREKFRKLSGKLSAMQHPHLPTIYDIFTEANGVFIVTQTLNGESIAHRLAQGSIGQLGVWRLASDLLEALYAAHSSGVIHGALHTGSIMRTPRATGGHRHMLIDLGHNHLATMIKGHRVHIADPVLLAPELHDEYEKPTPQSDLFMLGQLCYTALIGGHPLSGQSTEQCAQVYKNGTLPHLENYVPDINPEFSKWVMSLLAYNPEDRPEDAASAMQSLHAITIDEPKPNVPGVTHAVETAEHITPVAEVSEAVYEHTNPAPGTKSKQTTMIAIGALCLVILIGVASIALRGSGDSNKPTEEQTAEKLTREILIGESTLVNSIANQNRPVQVKLDADATLDWLVTIGIPASQKTQEKPEGSYIQSILTSGNFKQYHAVNNPIRFTANGEEFFPRAATGNATGAKVGDGWEILLRVPNKQTPSFTVNLYMTQRHCDFRVEVEDASKKTTISTEVQATEPGVVQIPIQVNLPEPGDFFSIRVTATSKHPKHGFSIGLNGVHVESN
ncbi:MAG: serine/threonine protein kinase [Akkermansiaceae bacterium]